MERLSICRLVAFAHVALALVALSVCVPRRKY